jgi:hypothetical protein
MPYSITGMEVGQRYQFIKGKDVAKGTFHKILKDIGLSYEEFRKMK